MLKYKLIYFIILTIILLGVNLLLPPYYQATFLIRHIVIFIFIASVIIVLVKSLYNWLTNKYQHILNGQRLKIFNVFTIVFIGLLLFTATIIQNEYIERYESAGSVERCYHFDAYGNYVHGSTLAFQCPELNITVQNSERFEFQVMYHVDHSGDDTLKDLTHSTLKEGYIKIDVTIRYHDNGVIENYTIKDSRQFAVNQYDRDLDEHQTRKIFSSRYLEINTDFNDGTITQTKKADRHQRDIYDDRDLSDFEHYPFSLESPVLDHEIMLLYEDDNDALTFEIHDTFYDETLRYTGQIEAMNDYTSLYIITNPETLNIDPPVFDIHVQLFEDKTYLENFRADNHIAEAFRPFRDTVDIIQFGEDSTSYVENTIYDREEFSISEGGYGTFRINDTDYGRKVQDYYFTSDQALSPREAYQAFTNDLMNPDMDHFQFNPPRMIYTQRPWLELNPMFEYLINEFESN